MAFVDAEGEPWQELSCIVISPKQKNIVAVYHKYAACDPFADPWARLHIHGLSTSYLLKYGLKDEKTLIVDFKRWLKQFHVIIMYANNPAREQDKLRLPMLDIGLPQWIDRVHHSYHQIPQMYKMSSKPFCHITCNNHVHSEYVYRNFTDCTTYLQKVKADHGFHCSLADVHELYLFYLENYSLNSL